MKKSLLEKRLNEKYQTNNFQSLIPSTPEFAPPSKTAVSITEKFNRVIDEAVEFDKIESSEKGSTGGSKTDRSSIGKDESSEPSLYIKSQIKKNKQLKSIKR
jgi:hypothetical protein